MIVMNQQPDGRCFMCGLRITGDYILWKGDQQIEMHPTCAKTLGVNIIKEVTRLEKYYTSRELLAEDINNQIREETINDRRTGVGSSDSTSLVSGFTTKEDYGRPTEKATNHKIKSFTELTRRGFLK